MSESIIKISKEYKDFSGSIWLGREVTITEGVDNPFAAFQKAEQEMDSYFNSRGKPSLTDYNTGQPAEIQVEKPEIGDLPTQIQSCKELTVLHSYKFLVRGKPELEKLYFEKLDELS